MSARSVFEYNRKNQEDLKELANEMLPNVNYLLSNLKLFHRDLYNTLCKDEIIFELECKRQLWKELFSKEGK